MRRKVIDGMKRQGMLKWIRVVLGVGLFAGVNLVLLGLAGGCGWLLKGQVLPILLAGNLGGALVVGGMTVVLGRVFCSTMCPLGVWQDVLNRILPGRKRRLCGWREGMTKWRVGLFACAVVASVVGSSAVMATFDGYSLWGRIVAHLVRPMSEWGQNAVAWWLVREGELTIAHREVCVRGLCGLIGAGSGLVLVGVCVWGWGRIFCNLFCPVGMILGALSRRPVVRIRLDAETCVKCGLCAKACKANCIDVQTGRVDETRCIRCFNCLAACRKEAISWT